VGSLNHLLDPGDLVVCDDFVDLTTERAGEGVVGGRLLIMRQPVCPVGRAALLRGARRLAADRRLFSRGVYVVTEGPRFESPAEVRHLQGAGDVVGQSFSPEVWLARDIGACYAGIYLIVNYARGHSRRLEPRRAQAPLHRRRARHGTRGARRRRVVAADDSACRCRELRKPTLLH